MNVRKCENWNKNIPYDDVFQKSQNISLLNRYTVLSDPVFCTKMCQFSALIMDYFLYIYFIKLNFSNERFAISIQGV